MIPCFNQFSISQHFHQLSCKYVMNGKYIAVGNTNGLLTLYTTPELNCEATFLDEEIKKCSASATSVVSCNKSIFCAYINGIVKEWDIETQTCVNTVRAKPRSAGVVVHSNGKTILTYNFDDKIRQYDVLREKYLQCFCDKILAKKRCGHQRKVYSVKFHPKNENEFISGGWDDMIHFWDLRMANSLDYLHSVHVCAEDGLDISPNSQWLMATGYQKCSQAQIIPYDFPHSPPAIMNIKQKLYCGRFLNDNFIALGGTIHSNLFIINHRTQQLQCLNGDLYCRTEDVQILIDTSAKNILLEIHLPHDGVYALDTYLIEPSSDLDRVYAKIAATHGKTLTEVSFLYTPHMKQSDFAAFLSD